MIVNENPEPLILLTFSVIVQYLIKYTCAQYSPWLSYTHDQALCSMSGLTGVLYSGIQVLGTVLLYALLGCQSTNFLGGSMRYLQIVFFFAAVVVFISALFFTGMDSGDTLWRIGIAVLLIDIVCIMLWPRSLRKNVEATEQ